MQAEKQYLEVDTGPRRQAGPDRLCIATRSVRPVDDLIRFVAGPDGLVPDLKRKLPGRGVWVTARRQLVLEAVRRGAFKRSLKSDVRVPADLPDLVDRLMHRAALDALAIAQKAGEVVCGFAKTEAAIGRNELSALLHASEASRDGLAKLAAAVKRRHSGMADNLLRIHSFSSADLDLALGRANVVHAALLAGRAGETFLTRWRELERFRNAEAAVEDGTGQTNDETGAQTVAPRELGLE